MHECYSCLDRTMGFGHRDWLRQEISEQLLPPRHGMSNSYGNQFQWGTPSKTGGHKSPPNFDVHQRVPNCSSYPSKKHF